jgi:hypothetical protein
MLTFHVNGLGRVTASATLTRRTPPSAEVRAAQEREDCEDRLRYAVITAAKEARARGEVFDGITFEREVIAVNEL